MELYAAEGFGPMADALDRLVVSVAKPSFPTLWQRGVFDDVTMVLAGDVATACSDFINWLIMRAMAIRHATRGGSCSQGENLVAETDAEDRAVVMQKRLDLSRKVACAGGVTGPVREQPEVAVDVAESCVPG